MARLDSLRALVVQQLAAAGIENSSLDVDMLLEHVLGQTRTWLLTHGEAEVDEQHQLEFLRYVQRRSTQEPLAYIIGKREFYGADFLVQPGVLIPRPDTETVIETVKTLFADQPLGRFVEVGVGSGAISITLLKLFPGVEAVATDVSPIALSCAQENAVCNGVELSLLQTSLLDNVTGVFDLVVSNPPYIPTEVVAGLDVTVQHFEPHLALDGGQDGLDLYRKLIPQAYMMLATGGWCVLEHGYNQAADISAIFAASGFKGMVSFNDLGGHVRVTAAQKG